MTPSSRATGTLFIVPNTLDQGAGDDAIAIDELLPRRVLRVAAATTHWLVENAKSARAFLKRVDAVVPLGQPLRAISIVELPRPAKGTTRGGPALAAVDSDRLLAPALNGHDIALLSEAGLPAFADPGADVVAAAHAKAIRVVALPGASALPLAVAASGLGGQHVAFVGYLPVAADERAARLRELEAESRHEGQTQVAIETPYRNRTLLEAMLDALQPSTMLSLSVGLTLAGGWTRTDSVAGWRKAAPALPDDVPAVFAFLARR